MALWLTLFLSLFLGGTLYLLAPMLTPFIAGLVFAYLLDPLVEKMDDYGIPRAYASLFPVLLFLGGLLLLFVLLIPSLVEETTELLKKMPTYILWLKQNISQDQNVLFMLEKWGIHLTFSDLQGKLLSYTSHISHFSLQAVKSTLSGALAVVDVVSFFVLTPLVMFYILLDWTRFKNATKEMMPKKMRKTLLSLLSQIDLKLSALVRGQLMVALSLGVFYGVALSLSGLQMGFWVGLLTGLLSIIPFFGFLVGCVLAGVLGVLQYQFTAIEPYLILAAIFVAGQVLEGFVLTPKLLGDKVGLHPVWVIFALMAGGHILGILGMLIALPIAVIVQVVLPFILNKWSKKIDEKME